MTSDSFDLSARVASTTKDSIYIKWQVGNSLQSPKDLIQSFQVRYQAVGSTFVQYSQRLDAGTNAYDITQLHENTFYDICVKVFSKVNSSISASGPSSASSPPPPSSPLAAHDVCVKGTTATDSLAVALGSTFGAFLALGFIVFLVFLAKWQHSRKLRKQKLVTSAYDESGLEQLRGCEDPKEAFLVSGIRFRDDLAMSELSGQSSELSIALYADQLPDTADVMTSTQQSNAASNSLGDVLGSPQQADWIAVTPNSPPVTASEESSWLLRPPPIPGVIIRPQVQPWGINADQSEQKLSGHPTSSQTASENVHCSSDTRTGHTNVSGSGDSAAPDNFCHPVREDTNELSTVDQQQVHRPLKPTASTLW